MPIPIFTACFGGALGAASLFSLLGHTSRNPRRSLALVALVALLISFLLPILLLKPTDLSWPGVGLEILFTILLMHIIVAWLSVRALQRLATKNT